MTVEIPVSSPSLVCVNPGACQGAGAALAGAVAGDQVGYFGGRWGGAGLIERLGSRAAPLAKATSFLASRGGVAVFLSRWLVSALGP
jgi:membrane-associated protein